MSELETKLADAIEKVLSRGPLVVLPNIKEHVPSIIEMCKTMINDSKMDSDEKIQIVSGEQSPDLAMLAGLDRSSKSDIPPVPHSMFNGKQSSAAEAFSLQQVMLTC